MAGPLVFWDGENMLAVDAVLSSEWRARPLMAGGQGRIVMRMGLMEM